MFELEVLIVFLTFTIFLMQLCVWIMCIGYEFEWLENRAFAHQLKKALANLKKPWREAPGEFHRLPASLQYPFHLHEFPNVTNHIFSYQICNFLPIS